MAYSDLYCRFPISRSVLKRQPSKRLRSKIEAKFRILTSVKLGELRGRNYAEDAICEKIYKVSRLPDPR